MMKRLISLAIVFSVIFSLIAVPVSAIKSGQGENITPQKAKAYLDVINDVVNKYGIDINNNYKYDKGFYYADLIDFNGDGVEELYLIYSKNEFSFNDSIWGFNGSEAYLIGENTYEPRNISEIGLKKVGNKIYLCYEETSYFSYIDIERDKEINVEESTLMVQEVNGKELQVVTFISSELYFTYDKELIDESYSEGTGYANLESISAEQHNEISESYSIDDEDLLFRRVNTLFEHQIDGQTPTDFIESLKDKLTSSNMKDIYSEKSSEEKVAISKFLNGFRYFPYNGEYDISNPDQTVLAEFIYELFMRNYDIIEPVKQDSVEHRYDADGLSFQREYKEEDVNRIAMELFGMNIDFQKYLPYDYENGYIFIGQAYDAEPLTSIKINNIYSLENGLLYMSFEKFESWDYENKDVIEDSLYEDLPSSIKQNFHRIGQGHAIIREVLKNGKKSYQLIKYDTNGEYLTEEQLSKYLTKVNPEPNVSFDYSKVKDFKEGKEYINFFKNIISGLNGEKPNDKANGEIVTYIQHSIENSSTVAVNSNKNKIAIDKNVIEQASDAAEKTKLELVKILDDNNITLNKTIDIVLKINSQGLDSNKAMSIIFDTSIIEALGESNGIRVVLGDNQHTVYINNKDLRNIINKIGSISVHIQKDKDTDIYTIVFTDSKGTEISQLPYPISFSLPADNELATIFVNYKGGSDNWGGQYGSTTKSIEFSTRYSGEYSILKNEINISDIEDLTEEQQKAIKFMVSKGYFELEGDKFNGNGPLTRYDFTRALVKMFFALDRELETTFTDVEKSNQYYPYIASGQKDDIVKGFEDNTFRGDLNISKEQLIALCGRTLVDKKGYVYPENPKDYLSFVDSDSIADWATVDIAIAVQNGLIDNGGILMPQMEMSRDEGAEILYKLFMLLYEVPPVAVEIDEAVEATSESVEIKESGTSPVVIGSILGVLAIGGVGFYLFKRKNTVK
ncbi:S-layer homology domain-containing protein [Tissierella sp. Yu-01]|uniref:S-layer homology domain-containing protein n=1 Tax=Tissierella sp. Yu-01 TaxID=3035694 RepID=UPI00240DD3C3|nr:S-layer homology domain-containing protein [Tissierella sp. Yu-01]WFA08000.1 S-layer homology domain-containing protein [Tissierella sp. Yu-01]